ncbi:lipase maturation factor family protein [Spelaeicoccus albus]|uniref:Lipase maturation factor n=1 Tax=Spelaeicoccus albus TaxID=1280376 RepID=A0A7Z0D3Y9_9MICO|nr:lipase maturation factor family protein [Spelaeicoccus albus]NYI68447.1 hypothetical protein [Spelaeicoccus albus]
MSEFLTWFSAGDQRFARLVLQRGIAAVFAVAFFNAACQFRPLLGTHGLLPATDLLAATKFRQTPSIFHWRYSDGLLLVVAWTGVVVALVVVAGLPQLGPFWLPLAAFGVLWALYLSIVNVGRTFYGYGWESLLLEAGFLAAFLGSDRTAPPAAILWLTRWLVFRVEFGAGLIKIRGDTVWRDLTALYYHHETQPMPNPLSRYFHHLPRPLHRIEVLGNHFAQLVVPFLLFAPQPIASIAAAVIIVTQLWLVLSGNFSWLNVVTMVLAFSALGDAQVGLLIPSVGGGLPPISVPFAAIIAAVTVFVLILSVRPALNLVSRRQLMNASFNPYHLVGAYGAFGSITRTRNEVVIECTGSRTLDADTVWHEYEFKGKPGDVRRIPRQFAPYHLRLDWQMWFLGLGASGQWFPALLTKLLQADRAVLKLIRVDPMAGARPTWVRATLWEYRFSTNAERRETGNDWVRTYLAEIVSPRSLSPK